MRNFNDFLHRKMVQYGVVKFDPSDLDSASQFVPYFESGQRIIVKMKYGETKRGYVGVTTGWKPSFLLMHNPRAIGSSILLGKEDSIIGTVPNKFRR